MEPATSPPSSSAPPSTTQKVRTISVLIVDEFGHEYSLELGGITSTQSAAEIIIALHSYLVEAYGSPYTRR